MPARTEHDGGTAGDSTSGTPARAWHRSTRCADDARCMAESNCVEAARLSAALIGVRDSTRPESVLPLTSERFSTLLRALKDRYER